MVPHTPFSGTFGASTASSTPSVPLNLKVPGDELGFALKVLSKDMQGSFGRLATTIDAIDTAKADALVLAQLKQQLQEQLGRLNEGMSLLGTMLETNSSEILKYVKKRKG